MTRQEGLRNQILKNVIITEMKLHHLLADRDMVNQDDTTVCHYYKTID